MVRLFPASLRRLWRYYQFGMVNTLFGYCLYALLVALGLNMYLAQIVAHVIGVGFNYFTYSRHVFQSEAASKLRYVLSYTFNYFLGLASLTAANLVFHSPYIAGLVAILFTSLVNFVVLRRLVFTPRIA